MRLDVAVMAFLACFCIVLPLHAAGVDLEVVLAADVSRSINSTEFELQRRGYAAALTDPRVLKAIHSRPDGAIGVCFVEWSGPGQQRIVVDWTELGDEEQAGSLAAAILGAARSFSGTTAIGAGIDFAAKRFAAAKWHARRRVIDVSGDGTSNSGDAVAAARDRAVAQGITINGLAIINNSPAFEDSSHTHPPGGLPDYYRSHVIGGAGSFLYVVRDFHSFAEAMAHKLSREIHVAERGGGERTAALRRPDPAAPRRIASE